MLLINRNNTLPLPASSMTQRIALIGETAACIFDDDESQESRTMRTSSPADGTQPMEADESQFWGPHCNAQVVHVPPPHKPPRARVLACTSSCCSYVGVTLAHPRLLDTHACHAVNMRTAEYAR